MVVEVVHGFLLVRHEENNLLFLITPTHRDCTDVEKVLIEKTLEQVDGNRHEAAKILGIGERTLYRKLKKYDLG